MHKAPRARLTKAAYTQAVERGKREVAAGYHALEAWYDPTTQRLMLTLSNGALVGLPVREIPYLARATPAQLKTVELLPTGSGVSWPVLEVDIGVPTLLTNLVGPRAIARGFARKGGEAKSEAKAAAARANGAKGGRPRKHAA